MKRAACIPAIGLILLILTATSFAQQKLPDMDFDNWDVRFGEVTVGEEGTVNIEVKNLGDEDLNVTEIVGSGDNTDEFTVKQGNAPFTVKGGETHTIVAAFMPIAEGVRKATWDFKSNAMYQPNVITLEGSGLKIDKPAEFKPSVDTVNFGEVLVNTPGEMSVDITNPGELDLVISSATLGGDNMAEFAILEGAAPFTVAPGMSHTMKFSFTPTAKGERKAEVAFQEENNAEPYFLALTGMCVLNPPEITFDSVDLDFGLIKVGQTSEQTVNISNTGDEDLEVLSVTIIGANANEFKVLSGDAPFIVKKGESHALVFSYVPTVVAFETPATAQAVLMKNYSDEEDVINLTGSAEEEEVVEPGDDDDDEGPIETQPIETQPIRKTWDEDFKKSNLQGPLSMQNMNALYALAGYGSMEWATATPEGHFYASLSLRMATFSEYDGEEDFDASLTFIDIMARYGIIENLEAGLKLRLGGWTGTILVPGLPPDSEGSFGLGDAFLSAKYTAIQRDTLSMPMEMAALLQIKLPLGSQDDALGTGALGIAMNLHNSFYFTEEEKLAVHVMLGFAYAMDGDKIETDEFDSWGFLFNGGLGASYIVMENRDMSIAVMWQIEYYSPNIETSLGGRANLNMGGLNIMPELGFTYGLHDLAADMSFYLSCGILF